MIRRLRRIPHYAIKIVKLLKREGVINASIKALQKVQKHQQRNTSKSQAKIQYTSLVKVEDVIAADWSANKYQPKLLPAKATYVINWVMSPPGGGGGHQNIFRFIEYLDKLGYKNNVYLYSTYDDMPTSQAKENVQAYCKAKNLTFDRYEKGMTPSDIIFATGWETAYPVFNEKTDARKMYFVQDFEPYFYPMGTDYILAENTYRLGFHGVTAGGWLEDKLTKEYGMQCDHYDFGADRTVYKQTNKGLRKEIFFYARPVTERRGFDLGIMALGIFHKKMPEYTINLAGWDVSGYDIPFPYVNHKAVPINELPAIYNKCAAALVLSLTNMSLLPLELLASGTIPVVNDGPNNRQVSNNPYIAYTEASPSALAQKLIEVVTKEDQLEYAEKAADSTHSASWDAAGKKFVSIIEKEFSDG